MASKGQKFRKYTKEFKLKAVKRVINGGETQYQVESDLGLSSGMMHRWLKEYFQEGEENVWAGKTGRPKVVDLSEDELRYEILKKFKAFLDQ